MVRRGSHNRLALLAICGLAPLCAGPAGAGPNGATVVGGSATIQGAGSSSVTVNQSSQRAIINWNTFNIGAGETTTFNQPNSSSVALNRVTGGLGPSQLLGTLMANGQVFIVNGDGILIGPNAVINTAGFLATTNDIRNQDFMAGHYNFSIPGLPNSSVVNLGTITATSGGFAALVAPGVRNAGTITATLGTVALAAGNAFTLDFYGDKLITLAVNDQIASKVIDVATGQPLGALVGNSGKLKANGGRVELTAAAARTVVDAVINNTGVIEANSIGTHNGMIVLSAATGASKPAGAPTQTVKLSGKISAAGKKTGTTGGTVVVTGENIQLTGAKINASGGAGGGTVLIGGDTGGGHPSALAASIAGAGLEPFAVPTATTVNVDAASAINASATRRGNGGKVVIWSDQQTTFAGTIFARGGASGGNGGFVETSGHQALAYTGTVDTRAPNGSWGTLLLDPGDVTIQASGSDSVTGGGGAFTGSSAQVDSILTVATLESALASSSVVVQTDTSNTTCATYCGNINVNSSFAWNTGATLTLSAYQNINFAAGVTVANTGAGSLVLRADSTGTGTGTVNFASNNYNYNHYEGSNGSVVDFSKSTGTVSIFYNPKDNPAGSVVNQTSFTKPTDFSSFVKTNRYVSNQLTAYMLVNTVADLQNIQNNLSGTYALGRNIDASVTANWNHGAGFTPIGNSQHQFSGVLNGQGNLVDRLTINSSAQYVGLFGYLGSRASVQNLGLTNVSLTSSWSGPSNYGHDYDGGGQDDYAHIGALAGVSEGSILNSFATGTIKSGNSYQTAPDVGGLVGTNFGLLSQSYAAVNLTATGSGQDLYLGGLVGWNESGEITQSYSIGSVTYSGHSGGAAVGGLVGFSDGAVAYSYATGAVMGGSDVGGLIGSNAGSVTQTYATGPVSGGEGSSTGGLIGYNGYGAYVTQSYFDTTTSNQNFGIGNQHGSTGVHGLNSTQFMNRSSFVGWRFGTSLGTCGHEGGACWVIVDGDGSLNNAGGDAGATRPFLISEYSTTINNDHQLQLMALNPGASYTLANNISAGADLQNPSSMWGAAGFVPIGNIAFGGFTGNFNGQNYNIDGLAISPTDQNVKNIGLFGTVYGSVSNLTLTNIAVTANPNVGLPGQFVGTVAGQNAGTITNVSVTSGKVAGLSLAGVIAGGLVGQNGVFLNYNQTETPGTITQSFANVNVTVGDSVNCQGNDCNGGQNSAGGLVGSNTPNSIIENSVATGLYRRLIQQCGRAGRAELGNDRQLRRSHPCVGTVDLRSRRGLFLRGRSGECRLEQPGGRAGRLERREHREGVRHGRGHRRSRLAAGPAGQR